MKALIIALVIVFALVLSIMPLSAYAARKGLASPEKSWAEPAVYFAARTRMRLSSFVQAAAILESAVKTWPRSERIDEAYYWIAFCYERSEANVQAIAWYKAFLQAYPHHEWAAQARHRLDTLEAGAL